MIFVRVREDDPANVCHTESRLSQPGPQSFNRFFCFRPRIDDRDRIFFDEVDVNRPDVEGSWN